MLGVLSAQEKFLKFYPLIYCAITASLIMREKTFCPSSATFTSKVVLNSAILVLWTPIVDAVLLHCRF